MKRSINVILTFTILCISSISHGAEWWIFNISKESIVFIDIDSIRNDENNQKRSWAQYYENTGASSKVLYFFKCKDEEFGAKAIYNYKSDGSYESDSSREYVSYKPAAPESVGYNLLKVTCSDDPRSELTDELQGPLKDEVSPAEFSKRVFKMLEPERTPPINKKSVESKS